MNRIIQVILILALGGFLGAAVYYNFPVAVVNGRFVSGQEFEKRVLWYQSLVKALPVPEQELERQKKQILEKLIEEKIIAGLARKKGIEVSPKELDQYYQFLLQKFKDKPENLGIPEAEFKNFLVLPDLLEAKLKIAILEEATGSSNFRQAQVVMRKLNEGLDFTTAAEVYSEDEDSKYIGGDSGFLTRGELPPWFVDEVFALEVGERSNILVSPEGYHIFEVTARDENGDLPRVQVRQILIKGSPFEEFLAKEKAKYRIYTFQKL